MTVTGILVRAIIVASWSRTVNVIVTITVPGDMIGGGLLLGKDLPTRIPVNDVRSDLAMTTAQAVDTIR